MLEDQGRDDLAQGDGIHHDLIVMIPIINKGRNLHRFIDAK